MSQKETEAVVNTAVTLANIADGVFNVMHEIAGNDISSTINGTKISKEVLGGLIQNRVKAKLGIN